MHIFGAIISIGGWLLLLNPGGTMVNLHLLTLAGHVIYLGYFLILVHVVSAGFRRISAKPGSLIAPSAKSDSASTPAQVHAA